MGWFYRERRAAAVETIQLRQGLDVQIAGAPTQSIEPARPPRAVALVGEDHVGLRHKLLVQQGDRVRTGDPLFSDRRDPRIVFTAPTAGTVSAIHFCEKRVLRSVVLAADGTGDAVIFPRHAPAALAGLARETVQGILLRSGLWTALRSRPFGRIPLPDTEPGAIFITAVDTNPLAARPEVVVSEHRDDFVHGLKVVGRMADCAVFLCTGPGSDIPLQDAARCTKVAFSGPHPAGLPGTHIHVLRPAGLGRTVWHIGYQDVIAIGRLFTMGRLWSERVVSLAGPLVRRPRLVRTRLGADLTDLLEGEAEDGAACVISGSVLSGRRAEPPVGYLGRYHLQVSIMPAWLAGAERPRARSTSSTFVRFLQRKLGSNGALDGEAVAMFPLGAFERVMPLDILPTPMLRALAAGDTERALDLGCLELEEEDLALCSFVCPSRLDYGALLRRMLRQIEKEL